MSRKSRVKNSDAYLACVAAVIVFTLALCFCYADPAFHGDSMRPLLHVISSIAAAALLGICVTFESSRWFEGWIQMPLSLATIAGLVVVPVTLFLTPLQNLVAMTIIALMCARSLFVFCAGGWRRGVVPVCCGSLIGYWMFLLSYVDGYKTPWINEALLAGKTHVDLLFQSAIVNMLRFYGVGSLGVDGITPFPYHFGSHYLVAGGSTALGLDPLRFYSIAFPLLFCSAFITVLLVFVEAFKRRASVYFPHVDADRIPRVWFWIIFTLLFVGIIPPDIQRQSGIYYNVFHSESFGLGVLVAYVGGIWLLEVAHNGRVSVNNPTWYVMAALYLSVLCVLKISVAFVVAGVMAYGVLRVSWGWRRRAYAFCAILAPMCFGLWLTRSDAASNSGPGLMEMLRPFAFFRENVPDRFRFASAAVFFGPFIIYAVLRVLAFERISSFRDCINKIKTLGLFDVELLLICLGVSVAPGMLISVPQGSTNFFSEVSYWFMLPMLAVALAHYMQRYYCLSAVPALATPFIWPSQSLLESIRDRENSYTLIRLVLAVSVIYSNSFALTRAKGHIDYLTAALFPLTTVGSLAIQTLFFLSGLFAAQSLHRNPNIFNFLGKRALRLWPALFVCLVVTTILACVFSGRAPLQRYFLFDGVYDYILQNSALRLTPGIPGVFEQHASTFINAPVYALPLLSVMYALAACLSLLGLMSTRRRVIIGGLISLALITAPALLRALPLELFEAGHAQAAASLFLVGLIAYGAAGWIRPALWQGIVLALFMISSGGMIQGALLSVLAIWVIVSLGQSRFVRRIYRPSEDLSYGVFLYGWPAQQLVLTVLGPDINPYLLTLTALAVALAFAKLSWFFIESRAIWLGKFVAQSVSETPLATKPLRLGWAVGIGTVLLICLLMQVLTARYTFVPVSSLAVNIVSFGPTESRVGEKINPQPNGDSAIWIRVDGTPPRGSEVVLDGHRLVTQIEPGLATAKVSDDILNTPGAKRLYLERRFVDHVERSNIETLTIGK
ncbi:hypothetical protein M3I53_24060 [Paraburkholderia sp. CNPSo 3272]|uniref:acyltransferase family protein n=1 Tax=Paraburkholderia sp. CNPSo 3272 TaxID=2940931 RepID=UPI0020B8301C|nr:hypothetical protein [Paraburkholderia sp. CNPSo 3272]MCP3726166.1 hypothetical protein [Paraburkholderia sp. CNPSo 3272]